MPELAAPPASRHASGHRFRETAGRRAVASASLGPELEPRRRTIRKGPRAKRPISFPQTIRRRSANPSRSNILQVGCARRLPAAELTTQAGAVGTAAANRVQYRRSLDPEALEDQPAAPILLRRHLRRGWLPANRLRLEV